MFGRALTAAILMVTACGVIWAQSAPAFRSAGRPQSADRIVKRFTFDEAPLNASGIPEGWIRAQDDPAVPRERPGFPLWNQATIDLEAPAFRGGGSARLPTRGGSTSMRLKPGVIPVLPDARYVIATQVRTRNLKQARAGFIARHLDERGEPIPGAVFRSERVQSPDGWTQLSVTLPAQEGAAFIDIELLVLQPREFRERPLPEPLHVWDADYGGAAWFDDLVALQVPRITLTTETGSNVLAGDDPPKVSLHVRDLAGVPLGIELRMLDARGHPVDRASFQAPRGYLRRTWTAEPPGFGWYRLIAWVEGPAGPVAGGTLDMAWLAPVPVEDEERASPGLHWAPAPPVIGLRADELASEAIGLVPQIAAATRVGRVEIPAAADPGRSGSIPAEQERTERLLEAISALQTSDLEVALAIPRAPDRLTRQAGLARLDVIELLSEDLSLWSPFIRGAVDGLVHRVRRWRLGPAVRPPGHPALAPDAIEQAWRALEEMVPTPVIAAGLDPSRRLDPRLAAPGRILLAPVEGADGRGSLEDRLRAWRSAVDSVVPTDDALRGGPPELHLVIPAAPEPSALSPRSRAAASLRRALTAMTAWADIAGPDGLASTPGVDLLHPWRARPEARDRLMPMPELAAWRTLGDVFAGRRFDGGLDIRPDVHAALFAPAGDGRSDALPVMAVWQDGPSDEPAALEMLVAEGVVRAIDIFGNTRAVEPRRITESGIRAHRIPITEEPVFIEGVDLELVRFQVSLRLEPELILSRHARHQHELVADNPWDAAVRGHYYILEPGGFTDDSRRTSRSWQISPRQSPFRAGPEEDIRAPLDIRFSPVEEAGEKPLVIDVDLETEKHYGLIRVERQIQLGLPNVDMQLSFRRGPGEEGPGVFVEAVVINRRETPIGADLRSQAPGYPRGSTILPEVGPGESASRVFAFPDGDRRLAGLSVAVSMSLEDGSGRLTKTVEIPNFDAPGR